MIREVWKYEVPVTGAPVELEMPAGARVVHVQHQRELAAIVTLWAEVDSDMAPESRFFVVVGAGHPVVESAVYVGTDCVTPSLVLHLYEIPVGSTS